MKCLVAFLAVLAVVSAQSAPKPKVILVNQQPTQQPTFASADPSDGPLPTALPSFAPILLSTAAPVTPLSLAANSFGNLIRRPTSNQVLNYRPTSDDKNAQVLSIENEINPDGTYRYAYAIDNGIAAAAEGRLVNLYGDNDLLSQAVQGSFTWGYPDGSRVLITYTADENGYQPQGDAIPTSPPIPPLIARALEWTARRESERNRLAPLQPANL